MIVNKETHYFEDLTNDEANQLLNLAEKLHMRATVSLDHPILQMWLEVAAPNQNLFAIQSICNEYLPVRLAVSAAKHFRKECYAR